MTFNLNVLFPLLMGKQYCVRERNRMNEAVDIIFYIMRKIHITYLSCEMVILNMDNPTSGFYNFNW
jgi:hypothetical protein